MNEGERKEEEELEEEELYPPARWLKRQFYRIAIKRTCEKLSELKSDDAKLKFLEEEMKENERYREFAIQELMQAERIRKFLRGQMKKVKKHVENGKNTAEGI